MPLLLYDRYLSCQIAIKFSTKCIFSNFEFSTYKINIDTLIFITLDKGFVKTGNLFVKTGNLFAKTGNLFAKTGNLFVKTKFFFANLEFFVSSDLFLANRCNVLIVRWIRVYNAYCCICISLNISLL